MTILCNFIQSFEVFFFLFSSMTLLSNLAPLFLRTLMMNWLPLWTSFH